MIWLLGLFTLPAGIIGGRRYYLVQSLGFLTGLVAVAVWMAAPIAIWQAFGMGWVVAWLLPTTVLIFTSAAMRSSLGGG